MNALSLFSSAGIGEYYLKEIGINVIVANELIESRAKTHKSLYPSCEVINDDIVQVETKNRIIKACRDKDIKLVIATPPCQGVSTVGKNRTGESIYGDPRNYLVLSALEIIDSIKPDFFIIENVPRFQEMRLPMGNENIDLRELLKRKYGKEYEVNCDVLNAADYGVPQTRYRVVYRVWKKGHSWNLPQKEKQVTLREAIGDLPSIEPGESSGIKNHYARKHPGNQIDCMRYTPTGKSAFLNEVHYPKKKDGTPIKGYRNTYKRMRWDSPAPTITMRNEIISSQENVHPGKPIGEGKWSDARILSLRELFIVSSLPADMDKPDTVSETAFRQLVGEGVPPKMFKEIMKGIDYKCRIE